MSMSDCEKCWETPCTCGWDYRNCDKEFLVYMRDLFQSLIGSIYSWRKN
jgi:hypothetical protein